MSRFISKQSKRVSLNEKEWIEIRESVSYEELLPITKIIDPTNNSESAKAAIPMIELALTGWNFTDDDGKLVEFSKDSIHNLDSATVLEILPILTAQYFPEKKN